MHVECRTHAPAHSRCLINGVSLTPLINQYPFPSLLPFSIPGTGYKFSRQWLSIYYTLVLAQHLQEQRGAELSLQKPAASSPYFPGAFLISDPATEKFCQGWHRGCKNWPRIFCLGSNSFIIVFLFILTAPAIMCLIFRS